MRRYHDRERVQVLDSALDRLATIFELPPMEVWRVGDALIEDCIWTSPFLEYTCGHASRMRSMLARAVRNLEDPAGKAEVIAEAKAEYFTYLEECFRHACDRQRPEPAANLRSLVNSETAHAA